ncbi:MAG: MFS family permease [Granulosicoccus sp.]|jgi:MFS family permease
MSHHETAQTYFEACETGPSALAHSGVVVSGPHRNWISVSDSGLRGRRLGAAFELDYAGIGILIGLFMAPGLVLAIPAGYWGRFVSDRMMVVFGLGALAFGALVSSLATEIWAVGLGRIFAGAGFLVTTLYFTKMVADWFEGHEIATAMSILVMSWPFGIAMGQVGHAWLAVAYGWQISFQVASAYCLLAALGVFLFYKAPHD